MTEKDSSKEASGGGNDELLGQVGMPPTPPGPPPPAETPPPSGTPPLAGTPPPSGTPPPAGTPELRDNADQGLVEDLEEGPAGAKKATIEPEISSQPSSVPYDIGQAQETTRGKIALILLIILAMVIILAFLYLNSLPLDDKTKIYTDNLVTILQIIFGPVVTLVATALGYYFGSKSDKPPLPPNSGGGPTG